jgi:hypothetical protein
MVLYARVAPVVSVGTSIVKVLTSNIATLVATKAELLVKTLQVAVSFSTMVVLDLLPTSINKTIVFTQKVNARLVRRFKTYWERAISILTGV